jgi:hypothetical protein
MNHESARRVTEQLALIKARPLESLLRAELAEIGFVGYSDTVRSVREFVDRLAAIDFQPIPSHQLDRLVAPLTGLTAVIDQMAGLNPGTGDENPVTRRNKIIQDLVSTYSEVFYASAPILANSAAKTTAGLLSSFEAVVQEKFSLWESEAESFRASRLEAQEGVQIALANANKLQGEIVELAKLAGVTKHAVHFANATKDHATFARHWLIATALIGAVTAVVAFWTYHSVISSIDSFSTGQWLQFTITRVLVLSMFVSAMVWSSRNYKAHQHNWIVNRHRAQALETFLTFADAATSVEAKNAVLLQATQCIFSAQASGYTTNEPEMNLSQIPEIVRSIGGGIKH